MLETPKVLLLFILQIFLTRAQSSEDGNGGCIFPESEDRPFFFDIPGGTHSGSIIVDSIVHPEDAVLQIASVRSNNVKETNFTDRFTLERGEKGSFRILNSQTLRLPPYPFPHNETMLYMTIVCNDQAYPLITVRVNANMSHSPQFYDAPYRIGMSEASPIGFEVETPLLAIDWDPTPIYDIQFSLENGTDYFSLVEPTTVRSTGFLPEDVLEKWSPEQLPSIVKLRLEKKLDYDNGQTIFYLDIKAQDKSNHQLFNHTTLVVNVLDVDDFPPIFSSDDYFGVLEKTLEVGSLLHVTPPLKAVDGDRSINKPIVYSINAEAMDMFTIDADNGEIMLIDATVAAPETVVVKASQYDNESRSSTAVVKIRKEYPPPRFSTCSFSISLPENAPRGTHVLHLNIENRTPKTKISIINPDGTFELDKETVTITVKENKVLDRERFTTIELIVLIEDDSRAEEEISCQKARIHIELIDENDNSPTFDKEKYTFIIGGDMESGTLIGTFKATDPDEGENGRISYDFLTDSGEIPVEMHLARGTVNLIYNKEKDNGSKNFYHSLLQASDNGKQPRSKRVEVEIRREPPLIRREPPAKQKFRNDQTAKNSDSENDVEGILTPVTTVDSAAEELSTSTENLQMFTEFSKDNVEDESSNVVVNRNRKEDIEAVPSWPHTKILHFPESTRPMTPMSSTSRPTSTTTLRLPKQTRQPFGDREEAVPTTTGRHTDDVRLATMKRVQVNTAVPPELTTDTPFFSTRNMGREKTARPHAHSVTLLTRHDKGGTPSPTLITEDTLTRLTSSDALSDENSSIEEANEEGENFESIPVEIDRDPESFGFAEENYDFLLYGTVKPGQAIGRVVAGPNAEMYGLDRNAVGLFKIDFDSGDITADKHLPKHEPGTIHFSVSSTNGLHTAETAVSVNFDPRRNVLDAIPRFDQSRYTVHVTEGQTAKGVTTLRAYHRGVILNEANLIYSIVSDDNSLPFSIDENNGQLRVTRVLDRETTGFYDFEVRACLDVKPSQCGLCHVTMLVDDLNDNSPKFSASTYHIVIPSDLPRGSDVVHLTARDPDAGSNGVVSYAINPPSATFAVDAHNGQISVIGSLTDSRYVVIVEAFDHGIPKRTTHTELRITVEGSNPSAPEFDKQTYDVTLQSPVRAGSVVTGLHARDPDPGEDGRITYSFAKSEDPKTERDLQKFSINEHTGVVSAIVSLSAFDGPFHLPIEASDQSKVFSRKTQALLNVNIDGHATLRFLPLPSTVYISTDKMPGSIVLRASAYTSGSSEVAFRMIEHSSEFAMDGDLLKVISPLSQGTTKLTIRAETDSTHVDHNLRIVVMSDRDKYPVFPQLAYDLEIPLESHFPLHLHRFDPKLANGTLKFTLFPPTHIPIGLTLNQKTGDLVVGREYLESRANQDTVFIVVRAINIEYPQFFSDVGVSLSLISSRASIHFPHTQYRLVVEENTPIGTILNQSVQISPRPFSQSLQYSIVPSSIIGIHPDGSVFVRENINLEQLPVDEKASLNFVVTAQDGDQSSTTRLQLGIIDENEFLPTFDYLHYPAHISEDAKPGDLIVKVRAFDKDFTDGEHLNYNVTGGSGASLVRVLPDGRVVMGDKSLDREVVDRFDVTVEAIDQGGNRAETRVEVTVNDVNDNAPEVLNQPLVWNVTEDADGLADSFNILASDLDLGENGKVVFRILQGNEKAHFGLEQDSPFSTVLRLLKPVDRKEQPIHKLTIEARDMGTPSMMSLVTVTVNVKNINNKSPEFERTEYRQKAPSDLPPGFPIITAVAVDRDGDSVTYRLTGQGCEVLEVNRNGVISFSSDSSKRSLPSALNCLLEASDGLHSSSTAVVIEVEKVNVIVQNRVNHPPVYKSDSLIFNVDLIVEKDIKTPRRVLGVVDVVDPDNDILRLGIEPAEYRNLFEIDEKKRLLVRSGLSSLASQNVYSFLVVAEDNGTPPLSAFINIRVNVIGGKTTVINNQNIVTRIPIQNTQSTMVTPQILKSSDGSTTFIPRGEEEEAHRSTISNPTSSSSTSSTERLHIVTETPVVRTIPTGTTVSGSTKESTSSWNKVEGGSEATDGMTTVFVDEVKEKSSESSEVGEPFATGIFSQVTVTPTQHISEERKTAEVEGQTMTSAVPSEFSFSRPVYFAFMPEGRYSNGALLNIKPEPISTNGENVKYRMDDLQLQLPFFIKENTGELVIFDVDREKQSSYSFKIVAIDHSSELAMHASAIVNVTILDVNDNYPQFEGPATAIGVSRDTPPQSSLISFVATDSDAANNGKVAYTIQENNWFSIDWNNGLLSVKSPLTTAPDVLPLAITARDGGRPPLKTVHNVEIRLFNSDRMAPILPRDKMEAIVPVVNEKGFEVAQLLAGPTVNTTNKIIYSLQDSEFGLFQIGDNGRIRVGRVPNREEMNRYHQLNVTAENNWGKDSVILNVFVEGPVVVVPVEVPKPTKSKNGTCTFPTKMYNVEILENQEGRRKLAKVTSDCESEGREYNYVLWQGTDEFEVDQKTGDVFVTKPLDREKRSIHFLFINVTDGREQAKNRLIRRQINPVIEHAKAKLSSWQTLVVVRVKDENDNSPKFIRLTPESKYAASVDWQAPLLQPILKMQAQDNDERPKLAFGAHGADSEWFHINETSGLIQLAKGLYEEKRKEFHFTGTVSDGLHTSEVPVSIYKLSPDHNIVQLTADMPHNEVEEQVVENILQKMTNTELRVLVKQPFVNDNGQVDARRTHVFIYGLDHSSRAPLKRETLKAMLDKHTDELKGAPTRISAITLPTVSQSSMSLVDVLLMVICFVLIFVSLIVCCLVFSYCNRRHQRSSSKDYMVDAKGAGPRPYDVEVISRNTAQAVLSARPLPDPVDRGIDTRASSQETMDTRSTNRSDEQLVFSNSLRDYGSRSDRGLQKAYQTDVTLIGKGRHKVSDADTLSSTLRADNR